MQTDTALFESPSADVSIAAEQTQIAIPSMSALDALCAPAPLSLALRYVKPTVASRTTLPALKCVLLTAQTTNDNSGGQILISTSNLSATTSAWLAAHVHSPGSIAVPYATFSDLVSRLPQNATLHFQVDAATQQLRVQCDDIVTNIKGIAAHEFPQPPAWERGIEIELPGKEFKNIIRQVAYAAATDNARPVLTGVLIEIGAQGLAFAAADGFRMSLCARATSTRVQESTRVIVTAQALYDVEKIVGDDGALAIAISAAKTHIRFTMPNYRLVASLLEGNFPNLQSLVPTSHSTRVVVDTRALEAAIDLALIFAQHAQNLAIVEATPGENESAGTLQLAAVSAENGDMRRALNASVTGEAQKIGMNAKFLKEFVESVTTPQIAMQCTNPAAPIMFSEVGNPNYTHILMPMHLANGK